jgi:hypothetical protein
MKKPTYIARNRDGSLYGDPIPYTPLIVIVGSMVHKFALHCVGGAWIVAHPASGARVLDVKATHKGMPVSSRHLTLTQARPLAMAQLDAIIERAGSERFNQFLEEKTNEYA